jgi:hypothetical protein
MSVRRLETLARVRNRLTRARRHETARAFRSTNELANPKTKTDVARRAAVEFARERREARWTKVVRA